MTISSTISRWEYTGDGSTKAFTYSNKIFVNTELEVYSDNVLQTLTTDYTVSGVGETTGGTVTYVTAPASDVSVVIVRVVPDTQATDYPAGGAFPSTTMEDDFDRRTIVSQQQLEKIGRALSIPAGEAQVDVTLPVIATRASKYLGFDSDGKPVELDAPANTTAVSTYSAAQLLLATAAAWRTGLGLVIGTDVLASLADDPSPQLAAALDPNGQFIGRDKGGDITSASPLVIDTDGDYFDVTGTTGFSAMTVAANRSFVLRFVSTVAITVGSGITLNNASSNYTTAAGDIVVCQSTAANTVTGWIIKADGTAVVATGLPAPDFTSSEQTVTVDTLLEVAHGLGAIPILVQVVLRCKTANLNYSVGDEIVWHGTPVTSASSDRGVTVGSDSTNVFLVQGAEILIHDKSSFDDANVTAGSWRWVVKVWS